MLRYESVDAPSRSRVEIYPGRRRPARARVPRSAVRRVRRDRIVDFFDAVTTQRAMRCLRPDPIPEALLRRIMDAAICAPSGGNRQGWRFVAGRDPGPPARVGGLRPAG